MGGIFYDLVSIVQAAGVRVGQNSITAGWQSRARSSGGFPAAPLCVFWHHTASQTAVDNDLNWMIRSCPDRPVGNLLLDRDGIMWPIAAGASNCAGKGRAMSFSRGTGPANQGNIWGFQMEIANNGVGEPFPEAQIDAAFRISNALNAWVGNSPRDVTTHALGAGDGYTDRKIDTAKAAAVLGTWVPRSVNGSGTWSLADLRDECARRATVPGPTPDPDPGPDPDPEPPEEDDVTIWAVADGVTGIHYITDMATWKTEVVDHGLFGEGAAFGWRTLDNNGWVTWLGAGWSPFLASLPTMNVPVP